MRARRGALGLALATGVAGCALPQQMLASPADLADYRTFRLAAHEGRRLYEAQRYLDRHPNGAWAAEVRAAFDAEEPGWFEAAKTSRARAREYVVDLPQGPHVEAARALLVLFDEHQEDVEITTLLSDARRTAATLDYESGRRRRVGEVLLGEIAALSDPATWGARLDDPPPTLAAALRGDARPTWGATARAGLQASLVFVVPTPTGAVASAVDVRFQLWSEEGRIAQGGLRGDDLFVRWTEAMVVRPLDPGVEADRHLAATTVAEVLGGAFEATLPAARCAIPPRPGEILVRSCDGWSVSARMGDGPGTEDAVEVRGPAPSPLPPAPSPPPAPSSSPPAPSSPSSSPPSSSSSSPPAPSPPPSPRPGDAGAPAPASRAPTPGMR